MKSKGRALKEIFVKVSILKLMLMMMVVKA